MTGIAGGMQMMVSRVLLRAVAWLMMRSLAKRIPDVADRIMVADSVRRIVTVTGIAYGGLHGDAIGIMSDRQIRRATFEEASMWVD